MQETYINGNIFGSTHTFDTADIVIIPAFWDITASFRKGTAYAPNMVLDASYQLDSTECFKHTDVKVCYFVTDEIYYWKKINNQYRIKAESYISAREQGIYHKHIQEEINTICQKYTSYMYALALQCLDKQKILGLLGGEHSAPLGFIQAIDKRQKAFSILQIDAHADLRKAYQDMPHSHASIFYNVLQTCGTLRSLVQVGVRDFCREELDTIQNDARVHTFFDEHLQCRILEGETWKDICTDIIAKLDDNVYLSIDIDGLELQNMQHTGTPIPGGIPYDVCVYLIKRILQAGKRIIGFDISETSSVSQTEAIVTAKLLWKVCVFAAITQQK